MRHAVALLLTLLTSALSAAVVFVTGMAGGVFLWPPLFLLCVIAGHFCRLRPVAGIFFGLPLCGVPVMIAVVLWLNRARKHPAPGIHIDIEGVLLFLLVSASVAAVYMGFLRSIEAMTGGVTGEHELEAMQADEGV